MYTERQLEIAKKYNLDLSKNSQFRSLCNRHGINPDSIKDGDEYDTFKMLRRYDEECFSL